MIKKIISTIALIFFIGPAKSETQNSIYKCDAQVIGKIKSMGKVWDVNKSYTGVEALYSSDSSVGGQNFQGVLGGPGYAAQIYGFLGDDGTFSDSSIPGSNNSYTAASIIIDFLSSRDQVCGVKSANSGGKLTPEGITLNGSINIDEKFDKCMTKPKGLKFKTRVGGYAKLKMDLSCVLQML